MAETRTARRVQRAQEEQQVEGRPALVRSSGSREESSSQEVVLDIDLSQARKERALGRITRKEFDEIIDQALAEQDQMLGNELRHLRGCPNEGDMPRQEDSRVEAFDATGRNDLKYRTVRCMECGEGVVAVHVEEA